MKKSVVVCVGLLLAASMVGAVSHPSVRVGTPEEAAVAAQAVTALHARLMAQQVEPGVKRSIVVTPSDEEIKGIYSAESQFPLRVGVVTAVGIDVAIDDVVEVTEKATVQPYGAVRKVGGDMIWTTAVRSYGATGIRLHLTGVDLPEGVELAIYNDRGEAFAYTGRGPSGDGDFWTHTVTGGVAYLQLTGADVRGASFAIEELGYLGDTWVVGAGTGVAKAFCDYNASCVVNAGCGVASAARDATDAVAHMQYVKRPYVYVCSGGLIANDAGAPYFLTANHCISSDRVASTLEAYFFYEIACNASCPTQWSKPATPRTLGSSVVATNKTGDFTLLRLSQAAPAGTTMLGWDSNPVAFTNGVDLYRISHPSAAPQAYSTHTVSTSAGTCTSWPRGSWIYSKDTYGATEGGSSGSPVVNGNGDVVGQLSGACGTNLNDVCDEVRNSTVDGAFASYYSQISSYLGGGGGCTPFPEICTDGIDNDCDNLIDGADPDCQQSCFPKGTSCSSNDQCCSGVCHPRKLTCN